MARKPREHDPTREHDKLLAKSKGATEHRWADFIDKSCIINCDGKIYKGYFVALARDDSGEYRYLAYSKQITNGNYNGEFEEHWGRGDERYRGMPVRGNRSNHQWCKLALDPADLINGANKIYMDGRKDQSRIYPYSNLNIDSCTFEAIVKAAREKSRDYEDDHENWEIRDYLYKMFCKEEPKAVEIKPAIRQLDLEDE